MRYLTIIFLVVTACSREPAVLFPELPSGFPQMDFPEDNSYSPDRFELGRKLFFDTRLSADGSLSCSSCHLPSRAFTDGRRVSLGILDTPGIRNAPTLVNVGFKKQFFAEGGVRELKRTINPPLESPHEMGRKMADLMQVLEDDPRMVDLFRSAYDTTPNPASMAMALATYMRRILSWQAPIDDFLAGDQNALDPLEREGWRLFQEKGCNGCHVPPLFTDLAFHNIGLDSLPMDLGRGRLTRDTSDFGSFQTPTLRNISMTGPYFHDGRASDLEEVIRHYSKETPKPDGTDPRITGMVITPEEERAILSFLRALTDSSFLQNPIWYPGLDD